MKVRLEGNIIRYRISIDQKNQLLEKGYLCKKTALPHGGCIRYKINAEENRTAFECEKDDQGEKLILFLPHDKLATYVPQKNGIEIKAFSPSNEEITVYFEVDIFKKQ